MSVSAVEPFIVIIINLAFMSAIYAWPAYLKLNLSVEAIKCVEHGLPHK